MNMGKSSIIRVDVKPELLRWARKRAGRSTADLLKKFPKLELWESGEAKPTLKQLESFARTTYVPIGYLFLPEPPEEKLPIADLRTVGSTSPNLKTNLQEAAE